LIEEHAKTPQAEVEEIPADFYEECIQSLEVSLKLKQIELMERWQGKQDLNMIDIIHNIMTNTR
jgi:ABC-type oligopeptide transport system ATPase subunit